MAERAIISGNWLLTGDVPIVVCCSLPVTYLRAETMRTVVCLLVCLCSAVQARRSPLCVL